MALLSLYLAHSCRAYLRGTILKAADPFCIHSPRPTSATDSNAALGSNGSAYPSALVDIEQQPFCTVPLTRDDAERAQGLLWDAHTVVERAERATEFFARRVTVGGSTMRYWYTSFGERGASKRCAQQAGGRTLVISMHGGGGAPKAVNDEQWQNQKMLYTLREGLYCAPRAPTDNWNLWHEPHIDDQFDRLIRDMVLFEGVDPNKVYLTGYSAGGDGAYQLASRMADRFAAASAMGGHPNDSQPESLRNLPFTIHCGVCDTAYNRAGVAAEWAATLDGLRARDGGDGYKHWVKLHPCGHWMHGGETAGLEWMLTHSRVARPDKVVWVQSSRTHRRFYWLSASAPTGGAQVTAAVRGQRVEIEAAPSVGGLEVRLDDGMLNLDEAVEVVWGGQQLHTGSLARTIGMLQHTLCERGDPSAMYSAAVSLQCP
jgi:hypothetical protein